MRDSITKQCTLCKSFHRLRYLFSLSRAGILPFLDPSNLAQIACSLWSLFPGATVDPNEFPLQISIPYTHLSPRSQITKMMLPLLSKKQLASGEPHEE